MVCPYCGQQDSKVLDKRDSEAGAIRRRRECAVCHERYTTYERIALVDLVVLKKDGSAQPFDPEKVRAGIVLACRKRPVSSETVDRMVESIETKLQAGRSREVQASTIGELAMHELKAVDEVAYIRFASVYRSFTDAQAFQHEVAALLKLNLS